MYFHGHFDERYIDLICCKSILKVWVWVLLLPYTLDRVACTSMNVLRVKGKRLGEC